jgi:hypothetical protein
MRGKKAKMIRRLIAAAGLSRIAYRAVKRDANRAGRLASQNPTTQKPRKENA